jgi:hypothetical protein
MYIYIYIYIYIYVMPIIFCKIQVEFELSENRISFSIKVSGGSHINFFSCIKSTQSTRMVICKANKFSVIMLRIQNGKLKV